ncbi:MAG: hypothetical protein V4520_10000 [Bacteroidota bacterium]
MKNFYHQNPVFKILIFLGIALCGIIYGCRKDISANFNPAPSIASGPVVSTAKQWYVTNFPKKAKANQTTNAVSGEFDLSQFFNPDWDAAKSYTRFDDNVLEMPIDSASKIGLQTGSNFPSQNNSRTSVLILKQAGAYNAYLMTIVGDADYLNGDVSKLAKNSYSKRDTNFSGMLYYTTPNGKFVNGYTYLNGNVKGHLLDGILPYKQTVQSIKPNLVQYEVCTYWWQLVPDDSGGGYHKVWFTEPTNCHMVVEGDLPGGIPPSGSAPGPGSSPGSGGPGGTTPSNPTPCTPPNVDVTAIRANAVKVNLVQPPDGGFPPPTAPNPCPPVAPKPLIITTDVSVKNNPKLNCIIAKLGITNSAVNKFLANFMSSTKYNVTYKMDQFTSNANAYTEYTNNDPNVTIHIKTSYVNGSATAAEVARTMIHEMAHAYLAQKIISAGGPQNLKQNLDTDYQTLFNNYAKYVDPTTGQYKANANNDAQHEFMGEQLIDDIAKGIKDFVELNTPVTKNDALVTIDNYKALAWQTLQDTEAFGKFMTKSGETKASQDEKVRILKSGTTNDCN